MRVQVLNRLRALGVSPYRSVGGFEGLQDGIHLDFAAYGGAGFHYVKVPAGAATVAPFTSLFTFTGDNKSMYRNSAGLLVASVTNTPRIEYDASGNLLGLLIEGARTNLSLWSNDGTNAAWVKSNMTTAQTSTGPDGAANSATRLTASAGNATILQTVVSGSATRAYSVWLRRITGTGNIDLTVDNGVGWTTKTLTTSWQRFDISQAAVTNPVFGVRIVTNGDAIDFYGSQLESAAFPSSLIPTTTGSVARAADTCTRTLGSEFSTSVGTIFSHSIRGSVTGTGTPTHFSFDDTSGNERVISYYNFTNSTLRLLVTDGGAGQVDAAGGGTFTGSDKWAGAYAANDCATVLNGGTVGTDASATMPTMTTLHLGVGVSGSDQLFTHFRRFDYWPERKSNAFLQQVTA